MSSSKGETFQDIVDKNFLHYLASVEILETTEKYMFDILVSLFYDFLWSGVLAYGPVIVYLCN